MENNNQNTKLVERTRSLIAMIGWLCFASGLIVMILSSKIFILYAPLFLAAFIIGVIVLVKGRIANGVLLLVSTLIIAVMCCIGVLEGIGKICFGQRQKKHEVLSKIEFEEVYCYIEDELMCCEGKVRNKGHTTVRLVKIAIEWFSEDGVVLAKDWTYADSSDGMGPGEVKSFKIMTPLDERMQKYRYYVMDGYFVMND